eukprot:41680-Eustigmatos_ZCMA.PRE.1
MQRRRQHRVQDLCVGLTEDHDWLRLPRPRVGSRGVGTHADASGSTSHAQHATAASCARLCFAWPVVVV